MRHLLCTFLSHTVVCVYWVLVYFSFSRISSALMPLASNIFSTASASVFLASSAALASAFAFFSFRSAFKVYFQPHTKFPAQSLHLCFGSVAPCPTLKPDVTISIPRTRYRRLARPYLIGFSYCMIISLPKTLSGVKSSLFLSEHNHLYADSSSQKPVDDIHNFYAIVISE